MGAWNTQGLRGSTFEEMINLTNEQYKEKGLAIIQKIPTPITPTQLDAQTRTISKAYFQKKSTVDYIGAVQGIPVCFDVKETSRKSFPLQNIHAHQLDFMENFEAQGGTAFILVRFQAYNEIYFLHFAQLKLHMQGPRKSIPYAQFDKRFIVEKSQFFLVHYLEALNVHLMSKIV